jgi:hypothetical protein
VQERWNKKNADISHGVKGMNVKPSSAILDLYQERLPFRTEQGSQYHQLNLYDQKRHAF